MEHFKEILIRIYNMIIINSGDSETDKVKKIVWYSFIGGIFMMFIIAWFILVILTFNDTTVKIPGINGDNHFEALKKLAEKKLIADATPRYTDEYPYGVVFGQRPGQGTIVKKGRVVSFMVSLGKIENSTPDFKGMTFPVMIDLLNQKYPAETIPFKIEKPEYEFSDTIPKGLIIRQTPKENLPLVGVDKLQVWISNGPKSPDAKTIDDYTGKKISNIIDELQNLEIKYTYTLNFVNDKKRIGIITAQSIGKGALVSDIIKNNEILTLKVDTYLMIDNDKVKGTYLLEIPSLSVPEKLEVTLKNYQDSKNILKMNTKGGVIIPIPFTANENALLIIKLSDKIIGEIKLSDEIKKIDAN